MENKAFVGRVKALGLIELASPGPSSSSRLRLAAHQANYGVLHNTATTTGAPFRVRTQVCTHYYAVIGIYSRCSSYQGVRMRMRRNSGKARALL